MRAGKFHLNPCGLRSALIEQLEPRQLLALNVSATAPVPTELLDKIEPRIWSTAQRLNRHLKNSLLRVGLARADSSNRLQLYVHTIGQPDGIVSRLRALGARVTDVVPEMGLAEAFIPAGAVEAVARWSSVESLTLPDYAFTNSITSAGDSIHRADKVRSQFAAYGMDGTGIKIGIISDGVDHRANVGAELPPITVDPAHPGSGDEGTAMLEIVHDLAPGAQLYFSGPATNAEMVSSINYLVAQGCNVIADDLIFFGESYFSDSAVANAAANAISSGVVYVTSAGNFGSEAHYQAQYVQGGNVSGNAKYHRFSSSPVVDSNIMTIPAGGTFYVFLQWSDPWGASGNDYDLYLYNSAGVRQASSTTVQNGNDDPFEAIGVINNGSGTFTGQIRIVKRSSAAARELEMFTYGNGSLQFSTPGDALVGQEAADGVIAVAAARATTPTTVEYFSSRGGSTIYTNFATQTKIVRNSLDGTAIDGVQTQVGASGLWPYNPFYGTSAASPHAAAIAGLIRQAKPSLTPAQVAQIMADTATDMGSPGYDTASGAGLFDALDAVYKVFVPSVPVLDPASDSGVSDSDNLTNVTTPVLTGAAPAASYVRLLVDGVQSNTIQLGAGITTYSLVPAAPLLDGQHSITVRVAVSSSVALVNNSGSSAPLVIDIDTVAPTLSDSSFNFDGPTPQNLTYNFSESIAGSLQVADLDLFNTTTSTTIDPSSFAISNSPATQAVFTSPDLPFGALPDGIYEATIAAGSITDLAGNALPVGSVLNFFYLGGDPNHDGRVDAEDLGVLSANWQGIGKVFNQGDSTYDGIVDVNDLYALANNWLKDLFA